MQCPHCGRETDPLFKFCLYCGKDVGERKEVKKPSEEAVPAKESRVPPEQESSVPQASATIEQRQDKASVELSSAPAADAAGLEGVKVRQRVEPEKVPEESAKGPEICARQLRCPRCRAKVHPEDKVCRLCGASLVGVEKVARESAQRAPVSAKTSQLRAPRMEIGYLTIVNVVGGKETKRIPLHLGVNTLGRHRCEISFPEDDLLSPTHLRIVIQEQGAVQLECPGSRNGTYVRISSEVKLEHGDCFRIGQQLLRLELLDRLEPLVRPKESGAVVLGSPIGNNVWGRLTQVINETDSGSSFLLKGTNILLGREQGNITFPGDRYISSSHAILMRKANGIYLKDAGSSNGTYVRIQGKFNAQPGQFFMAGRQLFTVQLL